MLHINSFDVTAVTALHLYRKEKVHIDEVPLASFFPEF